MNQLRLTAAILVASGTLAAQHNQLTPQEKKEGWVLLFDGQTFKGWQAPGKLNPPGDSYSIEEGCLKAKKNPRFNEDLFTAEKYGDFEMLFDWRISEGGNSGVKYHIQDRIWIKEVKGMKFEDQVALAYQNRNDQRPERGQQYVVGFEYQCIDNDQHPDGRRGGSHATGALYDMVAPTAQRAKPVGEFNQSRLLVKGTHVEHWLNGEKVVDTDLKSPVVAGSAAKRWGKDSKVYDLLVNQPVREGYISLQNHNDEAWFRDLRIRRLK